MKAGKNSKYLRQQRWLTKCQSLPLILRIIAAFTCTVSAPGKASRNFKDFKIRELIKIVLGEFNGSGLILQMWWVQECSILWLVKYDCCVPFFSTILSLYFFPGLGFGWICYTAFNNILIYLPRNSCVELKYFFYCYDYEHHFEVFSFSFPLPLGNGNEIFTFKLASH